MRIVCAIDGSEYARWGVQALQALASREPESVVLLHVVDPSMLQASKGKNPAAVTRALAALDKAGKLLLREAERSARVALSQASTGPRTQFQTVLAHGPMAKTIANSARTSGFPCRVAGRTVPAPRRWLRGDDTSDPNPYIDLEHGMKALLLCLSTAVAASPLGLCLLTTIAASPLRAEPRHAIAMHGEPRYQPGFPHFDYAWPDAPKRGALRLSSIGTFDSLNPFIIKGDPAEGIAEYVYETLMARAQDEPFTLYGLLAESVEVPLDRSAITFTLRAEARFSDGQPVTVEDVLFSYATLRDRGRPNHRRYYGKVTSAQKLDDRRVRFVFAGDGDREMPLIMGLMPVLPRHRHTPETFEQTSLEKPVGSGPYVVAHVEAPRTIAYRRNPDWWGRNLPD